MFSEILLGSVCELTISCVTVDRLTPTSFAIVRADSPASRSNWMRQRSALPKIFNSSLIMLRKMV